MSEGRAPASLPERVYADLAEIARERTRGERAGQSLQASALVHEAWTRRTRGGEPPNRGEFLRSAAAAMRKLVAEHARARGRPKHQSAPTRGDAEWSEIADLGRDEELHHFAALEESIGRLEPRDPRVAEIVRLRFYAGLSIEESAEALGVSPRTVKREWTYARAWLQRELAPRE